MHSLHTSQIVVRLALPHFEGRSHWQRTISNGVGVVIFWGSESLKFKRVRVIEISTTLTRLKLTLRHRSGLDLVDSPKPPKSRHTSRDDRHDAE